MSKIRVLVVDDAVVMRKLISEALSRDAEIEVVGVAANGSIGLQRIPQLNPDVITLDVEMPDMDGLQMLIELRKTYPKLPVIMFSTLTMKAAATTLEALGNGATDYVTKPNNVGNVGECVKRLEQELIPKVKLHGRRSLQPKVAISSKQPAMPITSSPGSSKPVEIVCIGTSTGGPNALAEVFATLPADFPVPIVVVQHMPPLFTAMLALRLGGKSSLKFHEGEEGLELEPGHVYIAPGGKHMEVRRNSSKTVVHLQEEPPENSCRPSVDVLFRSVVEAYGGSVLAVVLTGMGQDGLRGCELIRERRGQILAQDEPSSVVWGMPGHVAEAGLADKVVPLSQVTMELLQRVKPGRPFPPLATYKNFSHGHIQV